MRCCPIVPKQGTEPDVAIYVAIPARVRLPPSASEMAVTEAPDYGTSAARGNGTALNDRRPPSIGNRQHFFGTREVSRSLARR